VTIGAVVSVGVSVADLILTNGDTAADLLAAAGKEGIILPWRDVLHEGPIAADLGICSVLRVAYLASRFRIAADDLAAEFEERDRVLRDHASFERIELWFEHDVYDQLQIIQILSSLADLGRSENVTLVQADDFLGAQSADTILRFASAAREVTGDDLDYAERLWADLAMPTPEPAFAQLTLPYAPLPYLAPALERFCEELPAPGTGLSRSERTALAGIDGGIANPHELFRALIQSEEAPFMGDASFFHILDDLAFCAEPLIAGLARQTEPDRDSARWTNASLTLTDAGEAVLAGDIDHVRLNGIDRWWAGTRLAGRSVWRFDREDDRLVPPA
jgi:hypothetical protein